MSRVWPYVRALVDVLDMKTFYTYDESEEKTEEPPALFVCYECKLNIHGGVFFMWDRTFCSNRCRMNHVDRSSPPEIHSQYNELIVPQGWLVPKPPHEDSYSDNICGTIRRSPSSCASDI